MCSESATPPILPAAGEAFDTIVDAVSRGRLAPAEVAGLTEGELEALYAAAQARLETGQPDAAAQLFSALVALMPYRARPWRALGIALHHMGALPDAAAAYRAALYLEPQHMLTACWAAEVSALLGDGASADAWVARAWASQDKAAHARLVQMGRPRGVGLSAEHTAAAARAPAQAPDRPPHATATPGARFSLQDGRLLPLATSRFFAADALAAAEMEPVLALAAGRPVPTVDASAAESTATMMALPMAAAPSREPTQTRRIVGPLGPPAYLGVDALTARRRGVPLLDGDDTMGTGGDVTATTQRPGHGGKS